MAYFSKITECLVSFVKNGLFDEKMTNIFVINRITVEFSAKNYQKSIFFILKLTYFLTKL
jgi:hypothetical protein